MNDLQDGVEGIELPDVDLEQGGGAGGGGGGGGRSILFAVIIVLILAFEAVSSHFLVKKMFFSKPPQQPAKAKVADKDGIGQVYQLTGIIVNPSGVNGNRHLLVDIGFESKSQKVIDELTAMEPLLRDNINTFLSAQRYEVLADITMRDKIRERIKDIANYNLTSGKVDKVYFIRYVLQ